MNRRFVFMLLLSLVCALGGQAQDELAHPFERVRERGIEALRQRLAELETPEKVAAARLSDPRWRVREGTGRALVTCGQLGRPDVISALRRYLSTEENSEVRLRVLEDMAAVLMEKGEARLTQLFPQPTPQMRLDLRRATRRAVTEALDRDLAAGTRWTEYRVFARYARLAPASAEICEEVVFDVSRPSDLRCLAALVLSSLDAKDFWGGGEQAPRKRLLEAFGADQERVPADLKMALFYGLARRGVDTAARTRRACEFAINDAIGGQLIESALYYLYALPPASARVAVADIRRCCEEFASFGYSDRELYSAAQLLRHCADAELVRGFLAELPEREENFALYFWYCALQDSLGVLPEAEREAARAKLLAWGGAEERVIPQIRLANFWYAQKATREGDPNDVVRDELVAPVRASALALRGEHEDSDFYAQRSAALLLGIFASEKNLPVLRRLLNHDSEAVRLAACLGANDDAHRSLMPRLVKICEDDGEYAAYAAALSLDTLGHPRGPEFLCDLLEGANRVLAPGALDKLRRRFEKSVAPEIPESPSAWRERAAAWRRRIAKK
jgi:HEAT repeat protein